MHIKPAGTFWEWRPLSRFLVVACENILRPWSQDHNPLSLNCKQVTKKPKISTELWCRSDKWAKSSAHVAKYGKRKKKHIITCGINAQDKKWQVQLNKNETEDMENSRTCPVFLKKKICKHVLGLKIRQKWIETPVTIKNILISQQRKHERPFR